MEIVLIIGGVVAFIVILIVLVYRYEKKRTEKWRGVAEQMGFEFAEKSDGAPGGYTFNLFTKGRSMKRKNIVSGKAKGLTVMRCDYQYTTGGGKNSSVVCTTICILQDDNLKMPQLSMRRELGFLDRIAEKFGAQDIDFDEDPVFSKTFVLQGKEEEALRQIFNQELRDYFVEHKDEFMLFEAGGNAVMISRGRRIKPEDVMQFMGLAFGVRDNL